MSIKTANYYVAVEDRTTEIRSELQKVDSKLNRLEKRHWKDWKARNKKQTSKRW